MITKIEIITLNQEAYIESLVRRYQIENAKLCYTPMEVNLKLEVVKELNTDVKYRNLEHFCI